MNRYPMNQNLSRKGRFRSNGSPWHRSFVPLAFTLASLSQSLATPLDDQIEAFGNAREQNAADVVEILKSGLNENRSALAFTSTRSWLTTHPDTSPELAYHAARAAERAGEWPVAVSFYRKFLNNPKVDGKLAAEAAPTIYRLLINHLDDPEAAYLLMREDGARLRGFGRAKQFDNWFLDRAVERRDLIAITEWLTAIHNGNDPLDRYEVYLNFLLREMETFGYEGEDLFAALQDLGAARRTRPVVKARLNWVMTILPLCPPAAELASAKKPIPENHFDSALPVAEALLKLAPYEGARAVVTGWMNFNAGDSGVFRNFVEPGRAGKAAPLLRAIRTLPTEQAQEILDMSVPQGKNRRMAEYLFTKLELQTLVRDLPEVFNTLEAPDVPLFDKDLSPEIAKAIAPNLARNPHKDAAMVRVWALPERRYSAAADQMMKSEMWRFDDIKDATHGLWHWSMWERDVKHDEPNKKYAGLDARYQQLKEEVDKKATGSQRKTAFDTLLKDLTSASPSIPGANILWDELFANAPDADRITMFKVLIADLSGDREHLLRRALNNSPFGGQRYAILRFEPDLSDSWRRWGRDSILKSIPEFADHLAGLLQKQMKAGTISEPIFGMWLHCVDPKKPEAQELIKALIASPAYGKIDPTYHAAAADDIMFGALAFTEALGDTEARYLSRELLALTEASTPAEIEAALKIAVDRVVKAPGSVAVIGLEPVARLETWSPNTRQNVLSFVSENAPIGEVPPRQGYEQLVIRVADSFLKSDNIAAIEPYAAGLWHAAAAADDTRVYRGAQALGRYIDAALAAEQPSVAMTLARMGQKSKTGRLLATNSDDRPKTLWGEINAAAGQAANAIGAIDIPVDESDPTYPIYRSHAEFVLGNLDSAWSLYEEHADKLTDVLSSLSPEYGLWLLNRNIRTDETDRAEQLVRELTIWSRQAEGMFSSGQEAELRISYADLAFSKGALPTARAWYRKVADAAEYQGTSYQLKAALGSIRVDRASKNFSAALDELDKLMRLPNPEFRMQVHYTRAEVLMEQENYAKALEELEAVLRRDPKHPDALILRGKVHYQMRKLVEASEIELGPSREDTVLVPGESLKINLRDPSLQVSGLGADIEVEVRAASGDVERLLLYQFGDSKDKFRAEIVTALGAPRKGDKVLQVLGEDEISYGYSKRFRDRMEDLPPDPTTTISVASDAQLALTAGAFPARAGERRLNIEELGLSTAQAALGTRTVRPGNPIYLRVIDSDRSTTPGVDELEVDLIASSGDLIRKLVLTETGPFTGEFQAVVPTASAQALAFASESAPGRDPNMAISREDYPGWQAEVGDPDKARTFGVDLNDNAAIYSMTVKTGTENPSLTHFVVQTSMNGREWSTRARYPEAKNPAPWDGRPQLSSMPTYRGGIPVTHAEENELPKEWLEKMELGTIREEVGYLAAYVSNLSDKDPPLVNTGHPGYSGLFRFRAMFYQPARAIRTFKVAGLPALDDNGLHQTIFLINGSTASNGEADDPLTITRELEPGLHTVEVWTHIGRADFLKRQPRILCDTVGTTELSECPPEMFDPETFPAAVQWELPQPAKINVEGPDFKINFGERTQARMVRFVINGFNGVAPSILKVTLDDRGGKTLLPVERDYQTLRSNDQLEVLPGDSIVARYEDPVTASPKRNRHEKSLGVAFNSGTITASFLNYETNREGERVLLLEPIRRFRIDDAIAIVINDPDLDATTERDTIDCTVTAASGQTVKLKALETEPHSGEFIARVFPVEGEPARSSEIRIQPGDVLTATYRDVENLDPGIPTDRTTSISHAQYVTPAVETYAVSSERLPAPEPEAELEDEGKPQKRRSTGGREVIEPRYELSYSHLPAEQAGVAPVDAIIGTDIHFDVIAPHLALAQSSTINAYVQTDAARRQAQAEGKAFDLTVPGTLKLTGSLKRESNEVLPGYHVASPVKAPTQSSQLEEGRFTFALPLILGTPPARSFATKSAAELPTSAIPDGLAVKAGDLVHVGFPWQDEQKKVHWHHLSFTVGSNAILDVMHNGYQENLFSAFVGEKVYLRLVAPGLDQSPNADTAEVILEGTSGARTRYELRETETHSGIFKGVFTVSYADETIPQELPPVALNGFPVRYGDDISVSYEDQRHQVNVKKGADGLIEPFSKRFTGGEMAVRTSFTLAECYFELAKKHRELEQESLARRQIGHARKLLAEALATHRDDELKAHAEYLLGNLAQEFGDLAKNDESKLPMYQDALARFIKIPTDYPDSEFAPKAQFKTALVYEKMGEIDNSVEEYVKLAYKYPNNELIPMVMSRLGGYFQKKGQQFKDQADPLREKTDDASVAEVLRLDELSYPEFLNAAMVFSKLQERFPEDPLAGMAGLRAAQNMMRAHQYGRAIDQFKVVIDNEQYDDADIRAQAVYWSGLCHERMVALMSDDNWRGRGQSMQAAYQLYRRVTFDFPDSKWAKYARGRLADSAFADIIEKENSTRQKMIEALEENLKNQRR